MRCFIILLITLLLCAGCSDTPTISVNPAETSPSETAQHSAPPSELPPDASPVYTYLDTISADIDGDGSPDTIEVVEDNAIRLLWNRPDGYVEYTVESITWLRYFRYFVADLTSDGQDEIILPLWTGGTGGMGVRMSSISCAGTARDFKH